MQCSCGAQCGESLYVNVRPLAPPLTRLMLIIEQGERQAKLHITLHCASHYRRPTLQSQPWNNVVLLLTEELHGA